MCSLWFAFLVTFHVPNPSWRHKIVPLDEPENKAQGGICRPASFESAVVAAHRTQLQLNCEDDAASACSMRAAM